MKKNLRLNRFLLFCLYGLAVAHLATLFGFLPPELLWDTTIKDTRSLIISEGITLVAFMIIIFLYGLCYRRVGVRKAYTITIAIERALMVYFALEILGAFLGTTLLYKSINITAYCLLFGLALWSSLNTIKLRNRLLQRVKRLNSYVA